MGNAIQTFWNEQWSEVEFKRPTRKTRYEISNFGRIKSVDKESGKEKIISGSTDKRGYKRLNVRLDDGSRDGKFLHQLVADAFVERIDEHHRFVIHLDYKKNNNNTDNLKWVTEGDWKKHMVSSPLFIQAREKQKNGSKLNAAQVKMIKRMLIRGKTKPKIIAKKFGITVTHLNRIKSGENWSHVSAD